MDTKNGIVVSLTAILVFFFFGCVQKELDQGSIKNLKVELSKTDSLYQAELSIKQGIGPNFLKQWSQQYWDLVTESPNDSIAPIAAKKSFEILENLKNPSLFQEKLNQLSIHDLAIRDIIPYWDRTIGSGEIKLSSPYVKKLEDIANNSKSTEVQISARYHLAEWLTKYKFLDNARNQLTALELDHNIYASNNKYGDGIQRMLKEVNHYSVGNILPKFQMNLLNGDLVSDKDLNGNVTFLYFYGSSCGSCVKMYPKITRLYNNYSSENFKVIGFALDWSVEYGFNSASDYEIFSKKFNINWPQSVDSALWDSLNVSALSTGYLIDSEGKIARVSRSDIVTNSISELENTSIEEAVNILISEI